MPPASVALDSRPSTSFSLNGSSRMTTLPPRPRLHSVLALALMLHCGAAANAQIGLQMKPPALKPLASFTLPDWGTSGAFSADGKQIAIGTYGKVLIVDVATKSVSREIKVKSGYVRGLAWLPDHSTLVTGCFGAVEFWNTADGKNIRSLKVKGYANDVKASPNGQLVAAAMETGNVQLWNSADGSERSTISAGKDPLLSVAFSADGARIAAAGGDDTRLSRPGVANVWNVADGSEAKALDVQPEKCAIDVAFSPDGSALYVGDMNDRVTVFDLSTGVARGFFGKHGRPVNSVVPMKDGTRVVSGSGGRFQDGNVVKVWTPADGKELATLEHHKGKVSRVALSPDESLLLTVSFDKTAALWTFADVLAPQTKPRLPEPKSEDARTPQTGLVLPLGPQFAADLKFPDEGKFKRVGIIGLDTSHATAFTKAFNAIQVPNPKTNKLTEPAFADPAPELEGFRITAAYPKGSPDIESSTKRVPEYTQTVREHNVKIVDSIPELLKEVDYVLLETNDGRPHLEQVLPVLKAGKPVFVDKPVAGNLADAVAIYEAARHYKVPVFTSSSLRFAPGAVAAREGKLGVIKSAEATGPLNFEPTHPDLYWYGVHGVEILFTAMGTGCQSVKRVAPDVVEGDWGGGRKGTYRASGKSAPQYSLTILGETPKEKFDVTKPLMPPVAVPGGPPVHAPSPYFALLVEIVKFYKTGVAPVTDSESLEIYAFMSAADESKKRGGAAVTLESVMSKARVDAREILKGKLN
ncbi:MAG TPA: Gfo/Idh/MocA family oxidoreductase [Caulifigura sp.]|nr:Gfo/Idh/MocA family oxidoreductase [Caulifigura sp.]